MFYFEESNQSVSAVGRTMGISEQIKVMIEKLFFFRNLMELKVHNRNINIHMTFFPPSIKLFAYVNKFQAICIEYTFGFVLYGEKKKEFTVKVKHIHAWAIFGNGSLFSIVLFVALTFSLTCSSFFVIELIYFFLCVIIR